MHILDQLRQIVDRHAVADMRRDDIRRKRDQRVIVPLIVHCLNPEQKIIQDELCRLSKLTILPDNCANKRREY